MDELEISACKLQNSQIGLGGWKRMGSWSNLRFCNLQPEISNSSILKIPLHLA